MTMHTTGREDPAPLTREDAVYDAGCALLKSAQTYERDRTDIIDNLTEREGAYERWCRILSLVLQPQHYTYSFVYSELRDMLEDAAMRVADGRVPQENDE